MIVKRYVGDTAEIALFRAKSELGEDAIILSSGPVRDAWWRFWQQRYQVLVAADVDRRANGAAGKPVPALRPAPTRKEPSEEYLDTPAVPVPSGVPDAEAARVAASAPLASKPPMRAPVVEGPPAPPALVAPAPAWDEVVGMLRGMDDRLRRLGMTPQGRSGEAYERLLASGLLSHWAERLALEIPSDGEPWQPHLEQAIIARLGPPEPVSLKEPVVLTAIGPTGSGKTTTLAKLAAHFTLVKKKRVLLVTTDTFRVAAPEQLKTFALILGVPLEIANRPQDVEQAVSRGHYDVVLVDTAGRSPFHDLHMAEIQSMVRAAGTGELLVMLPATMGPEAMVSAARRFAGDESGKLCFTKLDEAERPGSVISAALELGWPLSYMTDGQSVPEDIAIADPERLARWAVRGVDARG